MKSVNFDKMQNALCEAQTKLEPLKRAFANMDDKELPYLNVYQDVLALLVSINNDLCDYHTEAEKIQICAKKRLEEYAKTA